MNLPNKLSGTISITEISDQYTERILESQRNEEEDEDEEDEDEVMEDDSQVSRLLLPTIGILTTLTTHHHKPALLPIRGSSQQ